MPVRAAREDDTVEIKPAACADFAAAVEQAGVGACTVDNTQNGPVVSTTNCQIDRPIPSPDIVITAPANSDGLFVPFEQTEDATYVGRVVPGEKYSVPGSGNLIVQCYPPRTDMKSIRESTGW